MDFSYVLTQDSQDADADLKSLIGPDRNQIKKPVPPIWSEVFLYLFFCVHFCKKERLQSCVCFHAFHITYDLQIMRFFTNPHKPTILALSRPDPKKNVTTLLKAFGECQPLRELANLVSILAFLTLLLQCPSDII